MTELRECPAHGLVEGARCGECGRAGDRVLSTQRRVRLSTFLRRHLRHFPERVGLERSADGWVDAPDLVDAATEAFDWADGTTVGAVVAADPRNFERDGDRVRATRGHSVGLYAAGDSTSSRNADTAVPETLFVGTEQGRAVSTPAAEVASTDGGSVDLHTTVSGARAAARRHVHEPVVYAVDTGSLRAAGVELTRTGSDRFRAREVPDSCVYRLD